MFSTTFFNFTFLIIIFLYGKYSINIEQNKIEVLIKRRYAEILGEVEVTENTKITANY